jgi:uncharacterized spore protein YtfJ
MNEGLTEFLKNVADDAERRSDTLGRLLSAADPARVFGEPVTQGEYTVITACEIAGGGGFGSGMGFGQPRAQSGDTSTGAVAGVGGSPLEGAGGGGGGGGGSIGRPVAAIVIGPDGVEVQPVVDVTKIGVAALTALGAMAALSFKMLKR